jgi:V/A-type H+/Na+-transporting ATPase subunit I
MPFLRPTPMAKIGVVALKDDRDRVVTLLHDLGVMQVESVRREVLEQLPADRGSETQRVVGDQLVRFRGLLHALPKVDIPAAPKRFDNLDALLAAAKQVTIDPEVGFLKREEDQLVTDRTATKETLDLLRKFAFYTGRLDDLHAASVLTFLGEAPDEQYATLRPEIAGLSESLFLESRAEETVRFIVAVRRERADAVGRLAQQRGVQLVATPNLTGTIAEAAPKLEARLTDLDGRLAGLRERLAALARQWYATVATLEEAFAIENRKLEVVPKFGAGAQVFALEGWVAAKTRPSLEQGLDLLLDHRVLVYTVPTTEEPPTVMSNPPGIRWYEFFIRFYSLPQASEWDPTWVFAIAFPLFFGLMLGDWGYGLVILLICLWMIRGFPGGRYLPKFGRNLVKTIMSPPAMRSLAYALVPGTLLAIGIGIATNQFFGFAILPGVPTPFDKSNLSVTVPRLLYLAGYLGLGMVVLGFVLGALKEYFHHHRRAAVGKVGGILFAFSIAGFGLLFIHGGTSIFAFGSHPFTALSLAGLAGGLLLLIFGEGIQLGGMALIEVLSHILSYTRLVGILLASVVLALLINSIATGWIAGGIPVPGVGVALGLVLGIVLIVAGQSFNVILGVFEPGIQGARLIFVEHLSKFYTGNGKAFKPLASRRVHTLPANPAPAAPAPP